MGKYGQNSREKAMKKHQSLSVSDVVTGRNFKAIVIIMLRKYTCCEGTNMSPSREMEAIKKEQSGNSRIKNYNY